MDTDNYEQFRRTIYEQLWANHRAGVTERLWITNIFIVISMGVLAAIKDDLFCRNALPLIIFLMLLSVWAIFYTFKVNKVLGVRETATRKIESESRCEACSPNHKYKWIKIGRLFPILFAMWFCFLLFIVLTIVFESILVACSSPVGLLAAVMACYLSVVIFAFLFCFLYLRETKEPNIHRW